MDRDKSIAPTFPVMCPSVGYVTFVPLRGDDAEGLWAWPGMGKKYPPYSSAMIAQYAKTQGVKVIWRQELLWY